MTVLGIDPGPEMSAWVLWDGATVLNHQKEGNATLLGTLARDAFQRSDCLPTVVIEHIASYGMSVGAEVFETCVWIGRFWEAADHCLHPVSRLYRRDVTLHLCGQARAKDSNIRQALIDRFGGKEKAIGKKATPGPLYGIKADEWSALALAITWRDLHGTKVSEL